MIKISWRTRTNWHICVTPLRTIQQRHIIEGLTQMAKTYVEAIVCLQRQYNRPRLIHWAHVRTILDVAPLKNGHGKELRHLHDVVIQHLCALKAMGYAPSRPFITAMLELKLDQTT